MIEGRNMQITNADPIVDSDDDNGESDQQFWKRRSTEYNKLDWANRSNYLDAFFAACEFKSSDRLLDIGAGTGIIALHAAEHVKSVTGIDISPDMMDVAKNESASNVEFKLGDVRALEFEPESFEKATARMVFHHVLTDAEIGIQNVWRVLSPGGMLVLSEGVPPIRELGDWYTEMFALKEDRRTFFEEDLTALMSAAPFAKIESGIHMVHQASVRNWLENGAVSDENFKKIWEMHQGLDAEGKAAYNMTETDDDILIDMKFVIVRAIK